MRVIRAMFLGSTASRLKNCSPTLMAPEKSIQMLHRGPDRIRAARPLKDKRTAAQSTCSRMRHRGPDVTHLYSSALTSSACSLPGWT
jgi:hypothetical protein